MSCATSDLEVQEEGEEVVVVVAVVVETRKNEDHWRKVAEVAVSKLNLCGRIIQEDPDPFNPVRAFSCFFSG